MKTKSKNLNPDKSLELLLSVIASEEILEINEMMAIRGGEGDNIGTLPPVPPRP